MRTFVAISLPDAVRNSISDFVRECSYLNSEDVKYVSHSNRHLTLKFLGEINEALIEELSRSLSAICAAPFALSVKGTGMFEGSSGPRVLWAGAESCNGLIRLQKKIEDETFKIGFTRDVRVYSPHITIARVRAMSEASSIVEKIKQNINREFGRFNVDRFALYKSDLSAREPVYSIIKEFPLE